MLKGEHGKAIANARQAIFGILYENRREDKVRALQGCFESSLLCGEAEYSGDILNRLIRMTNRRAGVERYRLWLSLADWHLYMSNRSGKGRHPERAKLALRHAAGIGIMIDTRWGHSGCACEIGKRDEAMEKVIKKQPVKRVKGPSKPVMQVPAVLPS
jgi:hypothetical protein